MKKLLLLGLLGLLCRLLRRLLRLLGFLRHSIPHGVRVDVNVTRHARRSARVQPRLQSEPIRRNLSPVFQQCAGFVTSHTLFPVDDSRAVKVNRSQSLSFCFRVTRRAHAVRLSGFRFGARVRIVHQFTTTAWFIRHRSDSVKRASARMHRASGEAIPDHPECLGVVMSRTATDLRDRAQDAGNRAPWSRPC